MRQSIARNPNTLLKIVQLSKTFKGKTQDARALDSLTLAGERGTILAILGHNGAGKQNFSFIPYREGKWSEKKRVA